MALIAMFPLQVGVGGGGLGREALGGGARLVGRGAQFVGVEEGGGRVIGRRREGLEW